MSSSTAASPVRPHAYDAGLLLLRLVIGLTMAAHGTQHLFGWFGGPGVAGTGAAFAASGYPAGEVMAVVAGVSELLGGLGLALGLLTPLAAAAIVGTMINAAVLKGSGGFFIPTGVEYELVLATTAASLALTGPGRVALDRRLPGLPAHRIEHGVVAVLFGVIVAVAVLLVRG